MRARLAPIMLALSLLVAAPSARAGLTADTTYVDRGKTDFDTFLQLLNPYGTWSKIDGLGLHTARPPRAVHPRALALYRVWLVLAGRAAR